MSEPQHRKVNTTAARKTGTAAQRQPAQGTQMAQTRTATNGGTGRPRRKKKKNGCLTALLAIVLVCALAVGGVYAYFIISVSPDAATASLSELIRTPSEYKGDVVNILVCGIDYEEGREYGGGDGQTNDGMTDMILYVSFDVKNKSISMMQIPRNTLVGDYYKASNYQINSIALSNDGVPSLAEAVSEMLQVPVDYYVSIDMDALRDMVNAFGGVWVNIPHDIAYGGSYLEQGYRKLDGDAAEFFVRNRKGEGYANSDLDRLVMQRYFYQGLLRAFRTMTIWDAAKMLPVVANYVTTDMSSSTMVSLGVSLLKVDSANIMLCRMPVYFSGSPYYGNDVVVAAENETAALLNEYFRTYSEPVEPDGLHLYTDWSVTGDAYDADVQFMGQLDTESTDAQSAAGIDELD